MDEARSFVAGAGDSSSSRVSSSFEKLGDRTRFTVELRPGETTIVSWKKLLRDVSKAAGTVSAPAPTASVPEPSTSGVHPALESRLAPGQPAPNEVKDAAQPHRFNAVIEKIERLYMGKGSSDDEDLDDIPDDDQYDTEDSFIDDAELDEYFEVDKLKTKHDGFFVNRGKLENIEPSLSPTQQPKKRRRKEMVKGMSESDGSHPNKHLKVERKVSGKTALSVQNNALPTSLSPSGTSHPQKIMAENQPTGDGVACAKVLNGDAAKVHSDKSKETNDFFDSAHVKYYERSGSTRAQELETSFQQRGSSGHREPIDLNVAADKHPIQNVKSSLCYRREGSNSKPKGSTLDRAIRELEKLVAESRPHVGDLHDADATYQATKRRLPQEIKQKLAKVARVVQVSNGKVSQELLNRLMGIVGHLINLRTLKRNFKIMISESLSVNQEKDGKCQQIKREVVEMIKARGSSLISKTIEQRPGSADDFQESCLEDKGAIKLRYSMDHVLEDKICDLYDVFVDGLDDDVSRQARKLYAELAELWPKGTMDNHGIKRAICHAKERRRIIHDRNKDQERIKPKKLVAAKIEDMSQADSNSAAQPQHMEGGTFGNIGANVASYQNKLTSSVATNNTTTSPTSLSLSLSNPSVNNQDQNLSKQEKVKEVATHSHAEFRTQDGTPVKKKIKRKPEAQSSELHSRAEKISRLSEERQKSHKQQTAAVPAEATAPQNSSFQFSASPECQTADLTTG